MTLLSGNKVRSALLGILAVLIASAVIPNPAGAAPPAGEGELTITPGVVAFGATTVGANSTERPIEIHNTGTVTVIVSNVSLGGTDAAEFATGQNPCNGVTLGVGQSCTFDILFSPHSEGAKEAQARVFSSDAAGEESVELSGTGAAPQLSFEPGSYDFGLQPTHGEGDAETEFQVRNSGAATVQIGNIGFEGPDSNFFNTGNSNCFGAYLNPGQACHLEIRFRPQETIAYAADLRLSAGNVNFTAALSGEGGEAIITPTSGPFGSVGVGSTGATQTVTLANSGDLPGGFFIAFLTGGDVADFQLLSENCTAAPLAPGSTCSASVHFQPSSVGTKSATLTFIAGGEGGPLQIPLTGTGTGPRLILAPSRLAFGEQAIGTSGPGQSAKFTNAGSSPVEVTAASILGSDADQFRLSDSCSGVVLAPGASCQAALRFAPGEEGPASATLRILAGTQQLTVALSGNAVAPARVRLNLGSKLLRAKGRSLLVGRFACDALSECSVRVRATLTARVRAGGATHRRALALPSSRVDVAAGGTPNLRLGLTAAARSLLANRLGKAHLNLQYSWSSEGRSGASTVRPQVR